MQSTLAELLGGPPQEDAQQQQAAWKRWPAQPQIASVQGGNNGSGWDEQQEELAEQELAVLLPHQLRQNNQQALPALDRQAMDDAPPASDFSRRNMARLGGEGMAGIFNAGELCMASGVRRTAVQSQARCTMPAALPAPLPAAESAARGSTHKRAAGGSFMSALQDIRAGLSDDQRVRQAAQREQLKRDLEEQMRERKEAAARKKAQLAELEEREEAQLRAYWAQQARGAGDKGSPQRGGAASGAAAQQHNQTRGGAAVAAAAAPPLSARGRAGRAQAAGQAGAGEPLGAALGEARRGEALVQPGITVFLPPDKAAERRARQATHSCTEDAEAVGPLAGVPALQPPPTAWHHHQQQGAPLLTPAQAAAILAAANPALAAAGGVPFYPYAPPGLLPYLPPPATGAAFGASAAPGPVAGSDPQVLALLRELQQEQQHMRQQVAQQLEAVGRLSGDAAAARSERDRARLDLERVQRLLAERQGAAAGAASVSGGPASAAVAPLPLPPSTSEGDLMAVTTHVLPLGAHRIPSRLGTPAASARGPPQPLGVHHAEPLHLPARHRQQAVEPWQQQQGPSAAAGAAKQGGIKQRAAGAAGSARQGRDGRGKAMEPAGGKVAAKGGWRM